MTATCPVCGQTVATHDGRLVRHHGTQMRWSGARWFRTTCRGSGRRATPCPTCNGWNPVSGIRTRETVGLVCQNCGTDYGKAES